MCRPIRFTAAFYRAWRSCACACRRCKCAKLSATLSGNGPPQPKRDLKPGGLPYSRPDLFINLFPRWNQHYKDGWFFAATGGESGANVSVIFVFSC